MSKKSHGNRNRAVFLVELSKMTDEEIDALGDAMPASDPRFAAVYHEHRKRMPQRMQALMESRPASLSEEDAAAIMKDVMNPETIEQFLDETGNRETAREIVAGDNDALDQTIVEINDRHAARN